MNDKYTRTAFIVIKQFRNDILLTTNLYIPDSGRTKTKKKRHYKNAPPRAGRRLCLDSNVIENSSRSKKEIVTVVIIVVKSPAVMKLVKVNGQTVVNSLKIMKAQVTPQVKEQVTSQVKAQMKVGVTVNVLPAKVLPVKAQVTVGVTEALLTHLVTVKVLPVKMISLQLRLKASGESSKLKRKLEFCTRKKREIERKEVFIPFDRLKLQSRPRNWLN